MAVSTTKHIGVPNDLSCCDELDVINFVPVKLKDLCYKIIMQSSFVQENEATRVAMHVMTSPAILYKRMLSLPPYSLMSFPGFHVNPLREEQWKWTVQFYWTDMGVTTLERMEVVVHNVKEAISFFAIVINFYIKSKRMVVCCVSKSIFEMLWLTPLGHRMRHLLGNMMYDKIDDAYARCEVQSVWTVFNPESLFGIRRKNTLMSKSGYVSEIFWRLNRRELAYLYEPLQWKRSLLLRAGDIEQNPGPGFSFVEQVTPPLQVASVTRWLDDLCKGEIRYPIPRSLYSGEESKFVGSFKYWVPSCDEWTTIVSLLNFCVQEREDEVDKELVSDVLSRYFGPVWCHQGVVEDEEVVHEAVACGDRSLAVFDGSLCCMFSKVNSCFACQALLAECGSPVSQETWASAHQDFIKGSIDGSIVVISDLQCVVSTMTGRQWTVVEILQMLKKQKKGKHYCPHGRNEIQLHECFVCKRFQRYSMHIQKLFWRAIQVKTFLSPVCVETMVQQSQKQNGKAGLIANVPSKPRAAKKRNDIKRWMRKTRPGSHDPYWGRFSTMRDAQAAQVSAVAREKFRCYRRRKVDNRVKSSPLKLEDAMQTLFLVNVVERDDGLFGRRFEPKCPKIVDVIAEIPGKHVVNFLQQFNHLSKKVKEFNGFDDLMRTNTWQKTFEWLVVALMQSYLECETVDEIMENFMNRIGIITEFGIQSKLNLNAFGVLMFAVYLDSQGLSMKIHKDCVRLCDKGNMIYSNPTIVDYQLRVKNPDDELFGKLEVFRQSLLVQISLVKAVLYDVRMPCRFDCLWLSGSYLLARYWKECVYDVYDVPPIRKIEFVEETMFSVDDCVKRVLTSDEVTDKIAERFKTACATEMCAFKNAMDSVATACEDASGVANAFHSLVDDMKPRVDQMLTHMSDMAESGDVVTTMVKDMLKRLVGFIPHTSEGISWGHFPSRWWECVNVGDVLHLIKLYIMYVNTSSKVVKTMIVMMALHHLGILKKILNAAQYLWTAFKTAFIEETSDETWLDYLGQLFNPSDAGRAAWFCGLVIIMLCGVKLPGGSLVELGKKVMRMLTNMHFVGLGLLGGKRIFEYVHSVIQVSLDWIKENVFHIKKETEQNTVRVVKWVTRLKFFQTEEGIQLIRTSEQALDEASKLYEEGVALLIASRATDKFVPRDMMNLILSMQKESLMIQNLIYRVKHFTCFRPTLFHIQFVGNAGVGKSTLTSSVIENLRRSLFVNASHHNLVYTLSDAEHYDGYTGQLFIVGDDLWKYNDAKHCSTIIGLITNTPVLLPMAHLEDKGMYLDSEIMISSVNNPYPRIKDILCMEAVYRRRHCLVQVECDPDVIDKATSKFDLILFKKKYPNKSSTEFPHLTFSFLKPVNDTMQPYVTGSLDQYTYSEADELPAGLEQPLRGLRYDQMIGLCEARYRAVREEESKILPKEKYKRMNVDWSEIDQAIDTYFRGEPTTRFLQGVYMSPEVPFGGNMRQEMMWFEILEHPEKFEAMKKQADTFWKEVMLPYLDQLVDDPDGAAESQDEIQETMDEPTPSTSCGGDSWQTAYNEAMGNYAWDEACRRLFGEHPPGDFVDVETQRRQRLARGRGQVNRDPEAVEASTCLREIRGKNYMKIAQRYDLESFPRVNETLSEIVEERAAQRFRENVLKTLFTDGFYDHAMNARLGSGVAKVPNGGFGQMELDYITPYFLSKLEYIDGDWWYDLSEFEYSLYKSDKYRSMKHIESEVIKQAFEDKYNCSFEKFGLVVVFEDEYVLGTPAHLLMSSYAMTAQTYEFLDRLGLQQQKDLVAYYKSYMSLFSSYVFGKINIPTVETFVNRVMQKIRKFGYWLWETFVEDSRWIKTLIPAVAVVCAMVAVSDVFNPKCEETSKVLFKRSGARPIVGATPTFQQNLIDVCQSVSRRNLVKLQTDKGSFLGVKSGKYIYTVYHGVRAHIEKKQPFKLEFVPTSVHEAAWSVIIRPEQVAHYPNSDFCVLFSHDLPEARNVDGFFVDVGDLDMLTDHDLVHLAFGSDGEVNHIYRKPKMMDMNFDVCMKDGYSDTYNWVLSVDEVATLGTSGGPVLTTNDRLGGAKRIVGIQSFNKCRTGYIQGVSKDMISTCKKMIRLDRKEIVMEGPLLVDETQLPLTVELVTDHMDVCGSVPDDKIVGVLGKTKFIKTPLDKEFNSERVPAILSAFDSLVPAGTHPLQHSINKFGRDVMAPLPSNKLEKAVQDVSMYIRSKIGNCKLRVLDTEESILGHGIEGSGPLNTKTSLGLPYVWEKRQLKGKLDHIRIDEEGQLAYVSEQLLEDMRDLESSLLEGIVPPMSMYEFPKDELRPRAKAHGIGGPIKTRSITVMNVCYSLLFRKYQLDLSARMNAAADGYFQFCVGTNPEGPAWTNMYNCLKNKSSVNCFDFDVGNWDGHMTPQLFAAIVKVVNTLYGDDELTQNATLRHAIAHAAVCGYDQFLNLVFKKMRGMPSGFPGTAMYNTMGHMLVLYVFWLILCETSGHLEFANFNAYLQHVCVFFYGDDIVASVTDVVKEWFNPQSISGMYEEFGWPVTSACKKDVGGHVFRDLQEVTFLKRRFVVDQTFGQARALAQIELSVIDDLLCWMRVNSRTVVREQLMENVNNAFCFCFSHGREIYEGYRERVNKILLEKNLTLYYVSYDDMAVLMDTEYFGRA